MAVGGPPVKDLESAFLIIAEYNRSAQGFLVRELDRSVNLNREDILSPPCGTSAGASNLTAVTHVDDKRVEVIDAERVLSEVIGVREHVADDLGHELGVSSTEKTRVPASDDSIVARKQVCRSLQEDTGLETATARNRQQALDLLKQWAEGGGPKLERLLMVISDIGMPVMDGYTFTTGLRADPRPQQFSVILHTSISRVFNQTMVDRVGANPFIASFDPDAVARAVVDVVQQSS